MFDQSNGLRFDIYERIHLPAELPGIAELEEVELLPDIQVIQREDRAELYGQLLLTGLYRSEDDVTQRLEHAIPVEITIPLTRVSSLEDIGVEIENFDIDLLTMRTVNITGVLSLRGIGGIEATDRAPVWQEEEYTAAYSPAEEARAPQGQEGLQSEGDALYENSVWTYGEGSTEENTLEEREEIEAGIDQSLLSGSDSTAFYTPDSAHFEPAVPGVRQEAGVASYIDAVQNEQQNPYAPSNGQHSFNSSDFQQNAGAVQTAAFSQTPLSGTTAAQSEQVQEPLTWERREKDIINKSAAESAKQKTAGTADENAQVNAKADKVQNAEPPAAEADIPADVEANLQASADPDTDASEVLAVQGAVNPEEKQDLKVALGSKKEEASKEKEPLTFSSLLGSSRNRKEQEAEAVQEIPVEETSSPEVGNDTEWKSRFIRSSGGNQAFRKVRLCIVQREDTLDTIAEKYQLSARELGLYNRLSGQSVEEGQVLYIP